MILATVYTLLRLFAPSYADPFRTYALAIIGGILAVLLFVIRPAVWYVGEVLQALADSLPLSARIA